MSPLPMHLSIHQAIDTKLASHDDTINTLDSKMEALSKKVTELSHQFTIEMRDLKHSLTVDMKDVSKEVSGEIHKGIETMQKTLSKFLFRGAILVCLLIFNFLTIANILLPGVERFICIGRILPFDTNQRLHYESDEGIRGTN